ncbi:DUF2977 domain-containing protein [Staphylococcus xylosus]|uniref:DUF2977 domain-containing protein n=1 Tax=Staphylococcus xylosus TaxID=1288 RepID=UPI002DBF6490|nr:DUF2977 domain-containing protein [Staphylococcus xylosus]MEB8175511.1 DUF2977 domain-containing protein [Staphylococcus xylosus]
MKILLNDKKEITDYAIIGGFENGIEVDNIPNDFINNFKPLKYKYENGQISLNKNYSEEVSVPIKPPIVNTPNNDEELRKMFATMQVQLVQANTMVIQLSQQNAQLSQEIVKINQAIDDVKEVGKDEDVIPEV